MIQKEYMKLNEIRQDLFEMSNLTKDETNLAMTVWVSVKLHSSGPRIKVNFDASLSFNEKNNFSVSISDNPCVVAGGTEKNIIDKVGSRKLEDVYDWVKLNKDTLEKYWKFEISTKEMLNRIKAL